MVTSPLASRTVILWKHSWVGCRFELQVFSLEFVKYSLRGGKMRLQNDKFFHTNVNWRLKLALKLENHVGLDDKHTHTHKRDQMTVCLISIESHQIDIEARNPATTSTQARKCHEYLLSFLGVNRMHRQSKHVLACSCNLVGWNGDVYPWPHEFVRYFASKLFQHWHMNLIILF